MTMIVWSLRYRQTVSAGEIIKAKECFKCSEAHGIPCCHQKDGDINVQKACLVH